MVECPRGAQEVPDHELGAEAEVGPLDLAHAVLLNILKNLAFDDIFIDISLSCVSMICGGVKISKIY